MTFRFRERNIRAVVVDIEGTTTPVSFVYDVLFPYARKALRAFVRDHIDRPELGDTFASLRNEWTEDVARGEAPPPWRETTRDDRIASIIAYAEWLMDRDRKASGLKALQGHVWARGYDDGTLCGEVFPDVPDAFARWHAAGMLLAIFSSGSVPAQQMLFRTTLSGDLTRWISAYFDTAIGSKLSPESYARIAAALNVPPEALLFISDTLAEIDAARAAGCAALICVRTRNGRMSDRDRETVYDFSAVG